MECRCGATVDVVLDGAVADIDPQTIESDAMDEAEASHGWGSGAFCPACESEYQRECAEERRAKEDAA